MMMESPRFLNGAFGDQNGPRMAEEVGESPVSETWWFAISVMRLRLLDSGMRALMLVYVRLDTSDIADTVGLVSLGGRDLTNTVEPVDTGHPLLRGELYLTNKLMEVGEERCKDLLGARRSLVTSGGNDILGEVRVVL